MRASRKGAVLIEVLVALFITAIVFIAVYTTISISLVNTRYLQQVRKTADFASQVEEALVAGAGSEDVSIFDYVLNNYHSNSGITEIDLTEGQEYLITASSSGIKTVNYIDLIDEETMRDYRVQLFLISPNAVYLSENSLGTPFGSGIYSPDDSLMTFELRVQRNSQDWGQRGFSIYKERQPAVICYIFHVSRRRS